jgi:hypothetical protein
MAQTYQLLVGGLRQFEAKMHPGPLWCNPEPGFVLGVRVVVMVVAMVMVARGKNRRGKHQQKQGCSKHFFHARTVARILRQEKIDPGHASSQTTGGIDRSTRCNRENRMKLELANNQVVAVCSKSAFAESVFLNRNAFASSQPPSRPT